MNTKSISEFTPMVKELFLPEILSSELTLNCVKITTDKGGEALVEFYEENSLVLSIFYEEKIFRVEALDGELKNHLEQHFTNLHDWAFLQMFKNYDLNDIKNFLVKYIIPFYREYKED